MRLIYEEFINIFLSCLINIMVFTTSGPGDYISDILSVLLLGSVSLGFFILTMLSYRQNFVNRLTTDRAFRDKFGPLFNEIRLNHPLCLLFHPLFFVRRVIFCISMFFLASTPGFQVIIFVLLSLLQIFYLAIVRPFE
jgi:hypothetical protein